MATSSEKLDKSTPDAKWKEILNAQEYSILRNKSTEPPGTGQYNKLFDDGIYRCAGCSAPLYKSEHKFDSACGWPAFFDEIDGAIDRVEDFSMGMKRVEILCSNCGGHLGHVFEGEPYPTPTKIRHCVNSISVKFAKKEEMKEEEKALKSKMTDV